MTINDLKTGMVVQVQLEDDYDGYYVVYKDAIPMYPSDRLISSENYLVGIILGGRSLVFSYYK